MPESTIGFVIFSESFDCGIETRFHDLFPSIAGWSWMRSTTIKKLSIKGLISDWHCTRIHCASVINCHKLKAERTNVTGVIMNYPSALIMYTITDLSWILISLTEVVSRNLRSLLNIDGQRERIWRTWPRTFDHHNCLESIYGIWGDPVQKRKLLETYILQRGSFLLCQVFGNKGEWGTEYTKNSEIKVIMTGEFRTIILEIRF